MSLTRELKMHKEQAQKFMVLGDYVNNLQEELNRENQRVIDAEERIEWYEAEMIAREGKNLV